MVDRVELRSEDTPEDPKYVEEMARKGEALEKGLSPSDSEDGKGSEEPNADRPEWLPEKFKSPEDLAKAYAELEKKQGKQTTEEKPEGGTANDGLEIDAKQTEEQLSNKGIDMDDLRREYAEKGELADETYERLDKAGFTRADVDTYIEGQKAIASRVREQGHEVVGGEENYKAMAEWAKATLTPDEIVTFNKAIQDNGTRELAIRGLYSKFQNAEGYEPSRRVGGDPSNPSKGEVFNSRREIVEAMNDPKYKNDPAYRASVQEKLQRSDVI